MSIAIKTKNSAESPTHIYNFLSQNSEGRNI